MNICVEKTLMYEKYVRKCMMNFWVNFLNNSPPRDIQMLSVVQNQNMVKKDSPKSWKQKYFLFLPTSNRLSPKFEITKTDDIVHKSFLEQKIHTFCIRPHHTTYFPHFHITNNKNGTLFFLSISQFPDV